jgi:hypothetical protein
MIIFCKPRHLRVAPEYIGQAVPYNIGCCIQLKLCVTVSWQSQGTSAKYSLTLEASLQLYTPQGHNPLSEIFGARYVSECRIFRVLKR